MWLGVWSLYGQLILLAFLYLLLFNIHLYKGIICHTNPNQWSTFTKNMRSTFTFTYKRAYLQTLTITYNWHLNNYDPMIDTLAYFWRSLLRVKAKAWGVIIICHTNQLKMAKNKQWYSHGRASQTVRATPGINSSWCMHTYLSPCIHNCIHTCTYTQT